MRSRKRARPTLPPDTSTPTRAPSGRDVAGEQRRGGDRAARLGDELEAVEQERHRGEDLVVGDEHDLVDQRLHDRERPLARLGQHLPVGDVARDRDLDPLARRQRALGDCRRPRLDAHHARVRVQRLEDRRGAGHQPAAADRGDEQVERAGVLEELQRGGARAGGDARVVVGGHERHLPLLGELAARLHLRLGVAVVGGDLGAVALDGGELCGRRVLGHEDRRAHPELARRSATACAWLPELIAQTPRSRSSSPSDERKLKAPRNLKAPPRWKLSHFRCTAPPARSSSVREVITGVRCATPSSRRAAARTWSSSSISRP